GRIKIAIVSTASASTTTRTERLEVFWVTTSVSMLLNSFPFWEAIIRLNTAGPRVASSMLPHARERTRFTEAFMNFYATALWMRKIFLTAKFRRSSEINSVVLSEEHFGKAARSFSAIMKDFASHLVLRR